MGRNLPLAIAISCTVCTVIYTLTNVALYTVITPDEMLSSPAVAVEFANKMFGPFAFIMPIFVACSTIGSANGVIFTSSRLFYVGAREGHMPLVLTMINKNTRTPIPAVIFTGLLSIVFLALSDNIFSLINYIQIVYWLAIACVIAALFWLRKKMPDAERPIKVNLVFPIVFFLGCIALVIVPIVGSPKDTGDAFFSAIGIGIMLTAVPIYVIFVAWKSKPKCIGTASGILLFDSLNNDQIHPKVVSCCRRYEGIMSEFARLTYPRLFGYNLQNLNFVMRNVDMHWT
ncbi:unnamed protein product [Acanthocheilonema viteae]|uniref:Amino acid permease/ SLC12A domain-containing protein n=1 Tax=Acanthocheilonema viteae TaxID=6277 RepID=A0A498SUH3_ACAVI|nr:unnamed protein product [Acanthocheilonema viteae]